MHFSVLSLHIFFKYTYLFRGFFLFRSVFLSISRIPIYVRQSQTIFTQHWRLSQPTSSNQQPCLCMLPITSLPKSMQDYETTSNSLSRTFLSFLRPCLGAPEYLSPSYWMPFVVKRFWLGPLAPQQRHGDVLLIMKAHP